MVLMTMVIAALRFVSARSACGDGITADDAYVYSAMACQQ